MSKINIKKCDCGNELELRFHYGVLRQLANEKGELEEWFVFNCVECGASYKVRKPETKEIKNAD